MPNCALCKKPATRLVVRDDYDTLRRSYSLPMSDDVRDRMNGLLDSLVDGYTHLQCEQRHPSEDELEYEAKERDDY